MVWKRSGDGMAGIPPNDRKLRRPAKLFYIMRTRMACLMVSAIDRSVVRPVVDITNAKNGLFFLDITRGSDRIQRLLRIHTTSEGNASWQRPLGLSSIGRPAKVSPAFSY